MYTLYAGLPNDRPNLLLGIVIQTRGIQPAVPPDFSLTSSQPISRSIKRHWSTSSDDPQSSTAPKRKRRQQMVGFGGGTPPSLENDEEDATRTKSPGKSSKKGKSMQMSFYGEHQSSSDSNSSTKKSTSASTQPPPSGIKSILSQLSDEKLKELASAMSNIEESSAAVAKPAEVATSTITSPATGQMVTASAFSGPTHSAPAGTHHPVHPSENPALAKSNTQAFSGGGDRQQQARFHQPPNVSQLQRPPLHPHSYGGSSRVEVGGQRQNQSYPSPHGNDQRGFGPGAPPPPGGYSSSWGSPNAQSQPQFQPQGNDPYRGAPPQNSGPPPHQYADPQQHPGGPPPNQYSAPPPHHGSPHQYPGTPPQQSAHQYPNPHPSNHHGQHQQYSNAPQQQYSGSGPPSSAYPSQNYDPYQTQQHHQPQNNRGYNEGGSNRSWSQDGPPNAQHYDGGQARLDDLESRDYGHQSQSRRAPGWRERERDRDRHGWKERHSYSRGRDRR